MNQAEFYFFLRELRKTGDDHYYTVKELEKKVGEIKGFNGCVASVRRYLAKLYAFGFLEIDYPYSWNRGHRVKKRFTLDVSAPRSPLDPSLSVKDYRKQT